MRAVRFSCDSNEEVGDSSGSRKLGEILDDGICEASPDQTAPAISSSCTTERFCSLARYSRPNLMRIWSQGRTSSIGRSRWL